MGYYSDELSSNETFAYIEYRVAWIEHLFFQDVGSEKVMFYYGHPVFFFFYPWDIFREKS